MTTIHVRGRPIEMPGATSVGAAAMRAAEAFGHDVDSGRYVYVLRRPFAAEYLRAEDVIADYDGEQLVLHQFDRP